MIRNHLATSSNFLNLHSSKMLILGDFNVVIDESHKESFCETYNLIKSDKTATMLQKS